MGKNEVNIGAIIRSERRKLGISLEEASNRTGVSKTMLGQIERGESSPTLSTMWKISTGLRISLSTFLSPASGTEYHVTSLNDLEAVKDQDGKICVHTLFPFNPLMAFDYLYIVQMAGCYYTSTMHPNAKAEYLVVTQGVLTMHIGDKIYTLGVGDSISFAGGEKHAYENAGAETTIYQCIVCY